MAAAPRAVQLASGVIQRSYAENVPLTLLARRASVSPWQLSRAFRASTGITIMQYRAQVRLAQALRRFREEREDSLASLAVDLGFSHHSHFTATFVKILGALPSAMRRLTSGEQVFESVLSGRDVACASISSSAEKEEFL